MGFVFIGMETLDTCFHVPLAVCEFISAGMCSVRCLFIRGAECMRESLSDIHNLETSIHDDWG